MIFTIKSCFWFLLEFLLYRDLSRVYSFYNYISGTELLCKKVWACNDFVPHGKVQNLCLVAQTIHGLLGRSLLGYFRSKFDNWALVYSWLQAVAWRFTFAFVGPEFQVDGVTSQVGPRQVLVNLAPAITNENVHQPCSSSNAFCIYSFIFPSPIASDFGNHEFNPILLFGATLRSKFKQPINWVRSESRASRFSCFGSRAYRIRKLWWST